MSNLRSLAIITVLLVCSGSPSLALIWHPGTVDNAASVGTHSSLALTNAGQPVICYYNASTRDLKYAWKGTTVWRTQTVDSLGSVGKFCSLALDGADNAHISYYDATNGVLKYSTNASGAWVAEVAHEDRGDVVGQHTSIAVDTSGRPHIAYLHVTNDWDASRIDTGDVGKYPSIAVESDGTLHVSYYGFGSGNLMYATKPTVAWLPTTVDSAGDVGSYTSLALAAGSQPRISYYDATNRAVKHARLANSNWTVQTVDSAGNVGQGTSIDVDSNNRQSIAYYSTTGRDVKLARFDGAQWAIETIDTGGRVGRFPSLVIGPGDVAYVSYYDETNTALRFATQAGAWLFFSTDTGYRDGLKPNAGTANSTKFKFRVVYQDPRGWPPQRAQVLVRKNGTRFATWTLRSLDPVPNWIIGGRLYRTKKLPAGNYEFRFRAKDAAGNWAGGDPSSWQAGPTVTDGPLEGAVVVTLAAAPTSAGAQITLNLTGAASVQARVMNIAGREVKTLATDVQMESGLNTLLWNGIDETGLAAPAGVYMIVVDARSDDGERSRAACTVPLRR